MTGYSGRLRWSSQHHRSSEMSPRSRFSGVWRERQRDASTRIRRHQAFVLALVGGVRTYLNAETSTSILSKMCKIQTNGLRYDS